MSHLAEEYAKSCGVKIGKPVLKPHYFPILHDLYRTDNHRYIAYNYISGIDGFDYNNLIYERAANTNLIKSYIKNILQLVQICNKQKHHQISPQNVMSNALCGPRPIFSI